MRESLIETALKRRVCALGGKTFKFTSPGVKGVADQIVILPPDPTSPRRRRAGPKIIFVEVKRKGKKPGVHQLDFHRELTRMGCHTAIVDSLESIEEVLGC